MDDSAQTVSGGASFSFIKGAEDVLAPRDAKVFDWEQAAGKVRDQLAEAINARNVAFLLGSGCSSYVKNAQQLGIPTMKPIAKRFAETVGDMGNGAYATATERAALEEHLGLRMTDADYAANLELLMEVLYSVQVVLKRSTNTELQAASLTVSSIIAKAIHYIVASCTDGSFSKGDETVCGIYQRFYRKLVYRDRALPRPWVFTTNYDLFSEIAMDRLGIPYCNGFSGTVERRFNPATFRYSLAEQLDITARKWTAVDSFVYLCKLHGSINWIEEPRGLFPIREVQQPSAISGRMMIYPTPAKQNASFGSPYADLFREFQSHIVREQSVLFVLGYGFTDEHVNNIIFQALTIPTFRLIAFAPPDSGGVLRQLRELADPRVWIVGGEGTSEERKAHHFDTFIEKFMPEPPSSKIDTAVEKVLQTLIASSTRPDEERGQNADR